MVIDRQQQLDRQKLPGLRERLWGSAICTLAGKCASALALFGIHMILAKTLPVADYGAYVVAAAVAFVLGKLSQFGLGTIVLRDLQRSGATGASNRLIVRTTAALIAGGSACVGFAYLALCRLPGEMPGEQQAIVIVVWSALSAASSFSAEVLRGKDQFLLANLVGGQSGGVISNTILLSAVVVGAATGNLQHDSALVMSVCATSLAAAAGIGLALRATSHDMSQTLKPAVKSRRMLLEGFPILIVELVVLGIVPIESLIISGALSPSDVAIFSAVRRIIMLVTVPLVLVNTTIRPFVAELHSRHQLSKLTLLVRGSCTAALVLSMPLFLCVAAFAGPILSILFGASYAAGATALQILALSSLVFVGSGSCGLLLQMTGNQKASMYTSLLFGFLYTMLAPYAISAFGLTGAAVAAATLVCSRNLTQLFVSRALVGIWTCATLRPRRVLLAGGAAS